jgi:hypothetical protein
LARAGKKEAPTNKATVNVGLAHDGCPGDWLVLTAACYSIFKQRPEYRFRLTNGVCPEIMDNAPWLFRGRPHVEIRVDYGSFINRSNQHDPRFVSSFFYDMIAKLKLNCEYITNKPHIYLSPQETRQPRQVDGPYCVINAGYKRDYPVKSWGFDRWQAVVNWIIKEKGIKVVQVGERNPPYHVHEPLDGAVNLIGQTKTRQLYLLAYNSLFGLGHESYLHHIYASHFYANKDRESIPFVCVASGWNPKGWASYNTEAYITRQGQLDCCRLGGCWKANLKTCLHPKGDVAQCMDMIQPDEVIRAIENYYQGGLIAST